ncbi:MAG: Na+/H+ antiporter NhaC family protein [Clostridium sp.]|uniref:Na+/H+ antiporter NhaC family protein n=1 Tax=Clostridium sp. TaxID=1506 RepID=UPI002915AE31|nr:Na+/H+ antiporter NhaC family protein [Clostridium sp.]MDU7336881.1 Na+/H+ antiporter NhaC family protein [Clostridium sp.]
MIALLTNPILIAVVVMLVLCFVKVNVIFALIISSLVGGLLSGMTIPETMTLFTDGMVGNCEAGLSYVMLGAVAVIIERCGLTSRLSGKLGGIIKGSKIKLLLIFIFLSFLSQTFIPIHIAFMPMIIPGLLVLMNEMKLDRRLASCALAFGLKGTWVTFPLGFGLIFHTIVSQNMTKFGMPIAVMDVWHYTWFLGFGTLVGFIVAYFLYKKPREYAMGDNSFVQEEIVAENNVGGNGKALMKTQWAALFSVLTIVIVQLIFDTMILGALSGLLLFLLLGVVKLNDMQSAVEEGIGIMGFMAFVMLTAAGFSNVLSNSGQIDPLIHSTIAVLGTNKVVIVVVLILLGLILTIGTGSSFGTVPILAALYVPFAQVMGFSVGATVILITGAATMGECGSPASDSTLGPTAGLNADGQHDHIWDSCVPQIITLVLSALIFGIVGALIF